MKLLYIPFLFLLFVVNPLYSQVKDTSLCQVEGIVFDSVHNYVLRAATVAIYDSDTSKLISYQLTNNLGEFNLQVISKKERYKIAINYIGYKPVIKTFITGVETEIFNLGRLNMTSADHDLAEVTVLSIIPIRMNKDTLEFNPGAFKMGENAVVEDLLRKIQGVTIWGDGSITVNGHEVKSMLVDGKPFFGGDTKVATQNIPTKAVDKIQVYQQNRDPSNSTDSITEVNIKLKKDHNFGNFGKISAGIGTDQKYDLDGDINFFTPKTQVAIIGAANNVNKISNDLNKLLVNSTYKGVGTSVDYQSDFSMPGLNKALEGGISYQHDFNEKTNYFNTDRLTGNYLGHHDSAAILTTTRTTTALDVNNTLTQDSRTASNSLNTLESFNSTYSKKAGNYFFDVNASLNKNKVNNQTASMIVVLGNNQAIKSQNNSTTNSFSNHSNFTLSGNFGKADLNQISKINSNYSLSFGQDNKDQSLKSLFNSYSPDFQSQSVDRKYLMNRDYFDASFSIKINDLKKLTINGVHIAKFGIGNDFSISSNHNNNLVQDIDTLTEFYNKNSYLTTQTRYTAFTETPSITISRTFYKNLSNRYSHSLNLDFQLKEQFFHQENTALNTFQNFSHSYHSFIPNAIIGYTDIRDGVYRNIYTTNFSYNLNYPTADQLVALTDSSYLYNINRSNPTLKPSGMWELSLNLAHTDFKNSNAFNYGILLKAGITNNNISDSTIIDSVGREIHYQVNKGRSKFANSTLTLKKAFKINGHPFQLIAKNDLTISTNPNYLNGLLNSSTNIINAAEVKINYPINKFLSFTMGQSLRFYHLSQTGINSFNNSTKKTSISINSELTDKLTVNSNISYNNNTSSQSVATNYTIWNASFNYRFLKTNNAELKFSALDLLHQNSSVINYGSKNNLTIGTNNIIQQYFMVTISYFPRKFGKKDKE